MTSMSEYNIYNNPTSGKEIGKDILRRRRSLDEIPSKKNEKVKTVNRPGSSFLSLSNSQQGSKGVLRRLSDASEVSCECLYVFIL
jgi:hypothetical protein